MLADLAVGLAPDQPDRQRAAQLPARGLGADAAVEAGAQDEQFGLGHGALHTEQHAVVEQPGVVDAVGVGDQGVGHPARSSSRYQSALLRANRETSTTSTIPTCAASSANPARPSR